MVEYLQLSCPNCQRELRVRRQYVGLQVACSHCGRSFAVELPDDARGAATDAESPSYQTASEADRAALERQITELASELEKLRETELRHTTQLEQQRLESTALRQERDRLAHEFEQAHARNEELVDQIRSLDSKLAQPAAPVAIAADQQSTDELRSQVLKLQIQNDELRSVIHGLGITVG